MSGNTVVFMDSGLGGLSHCPEFSALSACARLVYFSDRAHFPYGPRPLNELKEILLCNASYLIERFDPCLIVIACNTASISALAALRALFPGVFFVGTVPAIKPAASSSVAKRIGIIATERTIKEPYIYDLARKHADGCSLVTLADAALVDFVESRYASSSRIERLAAARPSLQSCLSAGCDSIVLACTHFLFLADEFAELAGDSARIFDSREGVARRAAQLYSQCKKDEAESPLRLYLESVDADRPEGESIPGFEDENRKALIRSLGFEEFEALTLRQGGACEALGHGPFVPGALS